MKTQTLSVRVEAELIARIEKFEQSTGIERASLIRNAIIAVLNYHDEFNDITFPLAVTSGRKRAKAPNVRIG